MLPFCCDIVAWKPKQCATFFFSAFKQKYNLVLIGPKRERGDEVGKKKRKYIKWRVKIEKGEENKA